MLEKISGPSDIKKLNIDELYTLADETRAAVINRVSKIGGHKGPNLGVVEVTIAYHYVFSSPKDKIVFDVSHQCYPHKILTGRAEAFTDDSRFGEVTGYTNPAESEHDFFKVGHTSTSVSMALGMCKARDLMGTKENIVAFIGDGSLSGGEALEAIDYAGEYDKNLIIIVNDNDQSIAENHGGIYKSLRALRESDGKAKDNIFRSFGLDYRYLDDGHDIKKLVELFKNVKGIDHPIVLHVHTIKGKGLSFAENDREGWHSGGPFNLSDGTPKNPSEPDMTIHDCVIDLINRDKTAVIINAGTPGSFGIYGKERESLTKAGRFVDVGIAEENAMAMASGAAKIGGTAVFGTYAPFLQRTFDQLSHDLCLNNSPATVLVFSPGVTGFSSDTHTGIFDIQQFAGVPNLVYFDPSSKEELIKMFDYATRQKKHPSAIRVPAKLPTSGVADDTDYSLINKFKVVSDGADIAIIATGTTLPIALEARDICCAELGKHITVISPHFLSGLDEELLKNLENRHGLVITVEDGSVDGGFGQRVAGFYGNTDMKVINLGLKKEFFNIDNPQKILESVGISPKSIFALCKKYLKNA